MFKWIFAIIGDNIFEEDNSIRNLFFKSIRHPVTVNLLDEFLPWYSKNVTRFRILLKTVKLRSMFITWKTIVFRFCKNQFGLLTAKFQINFNTFYMTNAKVFNKYSYKNTEYTIFHWFLYFQCKLNLSNSYNINEA